jgi:nitrate/TMAO reductase-like tetraheme cytochrome c subunit
MSNNSKWGVFWLLVIGVFVGIILTAGTVATVQWAGSNSFCGNFCHSMNPVQVAYQKGTHGSNAIGMTITCSDCHLLNESKKHLSPIGYVELLAAKVKAGSVSGFGHIRGTINTPEKWLAARDELSKSVINEWNERKWSNCTNCHDLSKMNNPKKPMIGKIHQGFIAKPTSCVMCHKTAGHNYTEVEAYVKSENKWPTLEAVDAFTKAQKDKPAAK